MLDWCKAVGAPVETTCVVVMLIGTPATITVVVLLPVGVAIPVLPVVVAKLGSLGGLTVATVDGAAATAALSRPVVESGNAALPVAVGGCSVVGTEWCVGAGVAAAPVAGGERASFGLAGVGGCVDSFFSTPLWLGCSA